ncbi:MAG TPA: hypothetical protein VN922_09560, partial [Bacteroidia bacterium]|nr:hypothetical protein [Bacteroidia bacterium]
YPENLKFFNDFRQYWQSTWAQSLVQYHPEYAYYIICQQFETVQSPDTMSSFTFDQRMANCNTFNQAISAGFINSNYGSFSDPELRVPDFTIQNTQMYDPFLVDPIFENDNGGGTSVNALFKNTLKYYVVIGGTSYSMVEAAAITARCGGFGTIPPDTSCVNFGMDYFAEPPTHRAYDDSIKNKEWNYFKSFYFSAKQKLQKQVQNYYALHIADAYNGCIGNNNYAAVAWAMWTGTWPWQIFNPLQTCNCTNAVYYTNKQQRFVDNTNVPNQSLASSQNQYYQQTGQCPASADIMGFLNELAARHQLAGTNDTLQSYPEFGPLYSDIAGTLPPFGTDFFWNATVGGNTITAAITDNKNSSQCTFTLNNGGNFSSWNSVSSFENIKYTGTGSGGDAFTITAVIPTGNDSMPYLYKTVTGTSCITMHNCQLATQWSPSQLAIDMSTLMTGLAINGRLTNTDVNLENTIFKPLLTTSIVNTVGPPNQHLRWSFINNNEFELYDSANVNGGLRLNITGYSPASFTSSSLNTIVSFDSLTVTGQSTFTLNGADISGNTLATISFSCNFQGNASLNASAGPANIATGGLPTPTNCNGPYYSNVSALQSLIGNILGDYGNLGYYETLKYGDFNIVNSPYYTPEMQSFFPSFLDSTSSREIKTNISNSHGNYYYDSLKFKFYVSDTVGGTP